LETGGKDASIRPWLWILFLLVGPVFKSIAFQCYVFIATRTLVRMEGLLTQLVFEHSLRIRLKAESSNEKSEHVDQDNVAVVGTADSASTDSASIAECSTSNGDNENSSASTAAASREPTSDSSSSSKISSPKGKAKDKMSPPSTPKATGKAQDDSNLIGKINNLITTDLSNISEARHFLLLGKGNLFKLQRHLIHAICSDFSPCPSLPLHDIPSEITWMEVRSLFDLVFVLAMSYSAFSAYVGLASTVALLPVPGYVAKLVQDVQRARMKKV
jgi:hypothetical protein